MNLKNVNIVWFKRDLRFIDHTPLFLAEQEGIPILMLYFFEPSIMSYEDSDVRHWRFVYESLQEMQSKLKQFSTKIYIFHNEVEEVFNRLHEQYTIKTVFSHQEIGNRKTFDRDVRIQKFFDKNAILWNESQMHGVIRRLKNRENWEQRWKAEMQAKSKINDLSRCTFEILDEKFYRANKGLNLSNEIITRNKNFQQGGEDLAWRYLNSFLKERYVNYSKHISKPELSRKGCSRLSPYIAYGNISMRMVYQYTNQFYEKSKNKSAILNFVSRLHWHCHFIQKFESNCALEFENGNRNYDQLVKPRDAHYIEAWQKGKTGVPIVDACMRCVVATGYLNFRMRALVVSFFTFNLWQDWRELHFLPRQFLDYEPGIHYPQLQMQAGTTFGNSIRIYNPVKNSMEHDSEGFFIKKWLPELREIPPSLLHEPWKLNAMEQEFYKCKIGQDYPFPIVDLDESRKKASDLVYNIRK